MYRVKPKDCMAYFLMLPAIAIGTFVMILHGVDTRIWLQNILVWIASSILGSIFVANKNKNYSGKRSFIFHEITVVLVIILLILPFLFEGLNEVHRWIVLGPIRFNVANALLPLLIISLWNLSQRKHIFIVLALASTTLTILLLQPDASQVTAFASASILLIWKKINSKLMKVLYIIFITVILALTWMFLDNLAPVPYVEQILFLVADINVFLFVIGIISLALLLLPFFLFNKNNLFVSLGVYFAVTILTTFFGNFPMPIMGYGISPIIGYSIVMTLFIIHRKTIRV